MTRPRFTIRAGLSALAGRRLPGGCDDCAATQEVTHVAAGVYVLTIAHADDCPELDERNPA